MRKIIITFLTLICFSNVFAKHITGGEMIYDYLYGSGNTRTYRITLILFRDENCTGNCAQMPALVRIGIYNNDNNTPYNGIGTSATIDKDLDSIIGPLSLINTPSCISSVPNLVYKVGFYSIIVTLKNNNNGYSAAYQTCCRISNITNIIPTGANGEGATYPALIPGNNQLGNSSNIGDKSPRFSRTISVVCYDNAFSLDFSATDPDGDSLVYTMCAGFNGGSATDASPIEPTPYGDLVYQSGFSGLYPLGPNASINPRTGIITGIAPAPGKYVVSVCVSSYRNGEYISTHRKDFIITVAGCNFANATLSPEYITCDGFSYSFSNLSSSPLNLTSYWDFGDPNSLQNNYSTLSNPTHIFSDTGIYRIKLIVNKDDPNCADSTETIVKVFPGFVANFNYPPFMCRGVPVLFRDNTYAAFGYASQWSWNFGVLNTTADTSSFANPSFLYSDTGTYNVTLIASSIKGCKDTIVLPIKIIDKPKIFISNDTIICKIDGLQLNATSDIQNGNYSWYPNYNLSSTSISSPMAYPLIDTVYNVLFYINTSYPACSARDSIKVRVVDSVTLHLQQDTSICLTDSVQITTAGNALQFIWTPAGTLNNVYIKNPYATPNAPSTTYTVVANIGSCSKEKSIIINTVPYPNAYAGEDTMICLGTSAYLHASGGSGYTWYPGPYLNNTVISNPTAVNPKGNYIDYVVYVTDTAGCPKPSKDTVRVNIQQLIADAGPKDTSIVNGQPLQLNASAVGSNGNITYQWSPENLWLSSLNIPNPIATPDDDVIYFVEATSDIGCKSTDTIKVFYYLVLPDIYMPNAFTPNGDGTNDNIKPIALGVKSLDLFRIYNRWGELVFSTSVIGEGWNGTFKGNLQDPGTYIWYANAIDYKNKKIQKKGTLILIR